MVFHELRTTHNEKKGSNKMKIVLVASEVVPFAKTGGLADVAGALPKALAKKGVSVSVIMPYYSSISAKQFKIKPTKTKVRVKILDQEVEGKIYKTTTEDNINVYFIEQPKYFDRKELYQTKEGDFKDNAERFSFFSKAAIETILALKLKCDVIHCNDWQTSLIPVYLKTTYSNNKQLKGVKTLLTIHNLGYQGVFWHMDMPFLGLDWSLFTFDKLEFYGKINFLKGGIVFADAISTVSKKYAQEILSPEYGCGLENALKQRAHDIYGILNGIDYTDWDPKTDKFIPKKFTLSNLSGKESCKSELQKRFKLPLKKNVPVIGIVSRLAAQKGFDLLENAIPTIMEKDVQVVVLDTGETRYHELFEIFSKKYPTKMGVALTFNNAIAHLIEAGSDMFLMPSRYEPCGLNQMISMKYGTTPIVRATGGLDDSVIPFNFKTLKGNGFKFNNYDSNDMILSINQAIIGFHNKKIWKTLVKNDMNEDFSWDRSAKEYIALYKKLSVS